MDKRIKIVWYLSIVTILLIFGGQIYWLYNQYLYSSEGYNKQLYDDCKALVEQERNIRIHVWAGYLWSEHFRRLFFYIY